MASSSNCMAISQEFSPKIFVRSGAGLIENNGTIPGSSTTFGGGNIGALYFFNSRMALGVAYKAEFSSTNVPLRGFDIIARYYFWNMGTKTKTVNSAGDVIVKHQPWSLYVGADFANRDYYAKKTPLSGFTGTTAAANAEFGMDIKIYKNIEFNVELNATVLSFTSSDPRVRISWILLNSGFGYVW